MTNFYYGGERFAGLENMLEEKVDIPKACTIEMPKPIQETTEGRIGRYGPYLRRGDETRSIPEKIYPGDLTLETIEEIFNEKEPEDEPLGKQPETGEFIWIKKGPYGHYVQLGESKTRKSIPKGTPKSAWSWPLNFLPCLAPLESIRKQGNQLQRITAATAPILNAANRMPACGDPKHPWT